MNTQKVFISHATQDDAVVHDPRMTLEGQGISVWAKAYYYISGQVSSRARCEVAICFNIFHRPAL